MAKPGIGRAAFWRLSGGFWKRSVEAFWRFSGSFWKLLEVSGGSWKLLETLGGFWRLLEASGGFVEAFWMLLEASKDFWKLVEAFWMLLEALWKLSGRFGKLAGGFWRLLQLCGSFLEASGCNIFAIPRARQRPAHLPRQLRGCSADARRMAASVVGASLGRLGGRGIVETK